MEVFRWERAKSVYNEAKKLGKEPTWEVYSWLINECKATQEEAANIATSPKLKK